MKKINVQEFITIILIGGCCLAILLSVSDTKVVEPYHTISNYLIGICVIWFIIIGVSSFIKRKSNIGNQSTKSQP